MTIKLAPVLKRLANKSLRLAESNWAIAAVMATLSFLLLFKVLVLHNTTFFINLDNVDQFYTWYQKLSISVHKGYLPVWNANVFGGQSFAGELQPGVFYPLNLLWVVIFGTAKGISENALNYLVAFHFFLASFGGFLLIKQLNIRKWAAFLTGIIFAFSGMLAFRSVSQTAIFFGLSFIPYPLYFWAKYHDLPAKRLGWLVACGAALGLIILSGHVAPFYFSCLTLGFFELANILSKFTDFKTASLAAFSSIKKLILVLICATIVALPQIYVSATYLPHTYRVQANGYAGPGEKISYGDFSKSFSIEVHEFANLVDPVTYQIKEGNNIFIGLVPLAIIVLSIALGKERFKKSLFWAKHSRFNLWLLIFGTVAVIGYATWFAVILYELPLVYQIRELGRYSILLHLGLMMLLANALEVIAVIRLQAKHKKVMLLVGCFILVNATYLILLRKNYFNLHLALQELVLSLMLVTLAAVEHLNTRKILIGVLIIVTAAVNTTWFLQPIKSDTETPAVYNLPANLVDTLEATNGRYRVEILDNSIPINTGNVYNIQTMGGYAATVYAPYFELNHKSNVSPDLIKDVFGVQLIVQKHRPLAGDKVVYTNEAASIYVIKRESALPKFFSSDKPGSMSRDSYRPIDSSTAIYQDQYQKYSVSNESPTKAIISEISYKGWVARIDGKPTELSTYSIDGKPILKSIDLPAGTHDVELFYKPFKII